MTPEEFLRSKHVYDGATVFDRSAKEATIEVAELLEEYASIKVLEASGWIDMNERMPENFERVLCYTHIGNMVVQSYSIHSEQDDVWFKERCRHWMPLPPKPNKN